MNRRLLRPLLDAGFAVALAIVAVAEIWVPLPSAQGYGSANLSTVVAVILCLMLSVRSRWPLATALVVLLTWPIAFTIQPILILFWGQLVPIVVATYSVARYASRRGSYVGAAAAAVCLLFFDLLVAELQDAGEIFFHWLVVILAWVIGSVVRAAERRAAVSRQHAIELETESRTRVIAALAEERARIARELHDIVAHAVSVMTVQAGAAEQVVTEDPEFTRRALAAIRTTGSEALSEMRRLVSMLRDTHTRDGGTRDDDMHAGEKDNDSSASDASLRPQPGIAGLPTLIADAQGGGLNIQLRVEGAVQDLSNGLDLTLYRIVQEALTNVRKHSGASTATVVVRFSDDTVDLSVTNDGAAGSLNNSRDGSTERTATPRLDRRGGQGSGRGHGLIGMRERASLYGGTLEAAATPEGGFIVSASLPIPGTHLIAAPRVTNARMETP
ncbi:sensor histidine kinase [Leucobacter sp. HY1908]